MDADPPAPSAPRKMRFQPKAPPRRTPKPAETKLEATDEDPADGEAAAESLRRKLRERLVKRGPKVQKKSSVQVAFSHESTTSTSIRTYGIPREGNSGKNNASGSKGSAASDDKVLFPMRSTAEPGSKSGSDVNANNTLSQKKKKAFIEPWDYEHTYYPTTLPWRPPYSGDPVCLNKKAFGKAAKDEYNESTVHTASELGLMEKSDKPQLIFLQLPGLLPAVKPPARSQHTKEGTSSSKQSEVKGAPAQARGKAIVGGSGNTAASVAAEAKGKRLEELPQGGYMGKMLVYNNGKVKLKLGEEIYDVNPGVCVNAFQHVVAMDTAHKTCCELGKLEKRAVVSPDIDSLLNKQTGLKKTPRDLSDK